MDFKLIGSILLIVGTSIGAGMLALPIAAAELGFYGSLILLCACWFVMTMGALLILEVNLWLPTNSNIISMAKTTIGPLGQIIAWITYLLLLYSLLCAYIAGGSDLFRNIFVNQGFSISQGLSACLFTIVFGSIVFFGIRSVDYVNRGLMLFKFIAYFLFIIVLMPFVNNNQLIFGGMKSFASITAVTVTITSFGYATIVPSLRIYFAGDIRKLKMAIFAGSLIPLVCYILWDMVIMGVIPLSGEHGLMTIARSESSTSDMVNALSGIAASPFISGSVKVFTSICVLTSFLGVALCLTDFLADGLQLEKKGGKNVFIQLVTFLPALLIVLFFPHIFIKALAYAGIYCIVLLMLLPAWMVLKGRKRYAHEAHYRAPGGTWLLLAIIMISIAIIVWSLFDFLSVG
jgi:tyrosine-specific transport protein